MKLNRIAADIIRQANQKPGETIRMKLERGLVLSAKRIDRRWQLAAARTDVYPSDQEALIIARAFGVPIGTDPEWQIKKQRTQLATIDWHGIVWTWLEDETANQPALIPEPATYA